MLYCMKTHENSSEMLEIKKIASNKQYFIYGQASIYAHQNIYASTSFYASADMHMPPPLDLNMVENFIY